MIQLPNQPETPNVRYLAQRARERFTDLTTDTITLAHIPARTVRDEGLEGVFLNRALVDPDTYTIDGDTITLGSALIATDVVVVFYSYRT